VNSIEQIDEKFLKVEDELNLFEKEVEDTKIWEKVRFEVFREVLKEKSLISEPHTIPDQNYFSYVRHLVSGSIIGNPLFGGKTEILFIGHRRRKKLEDGEWWDIYCDPILDGLETNYSYLQARHKGEYKQPSKTDEIGRMDLFEYLPSALNKLNPYRLSQDDEKYFEEVERKFREEFEGEIEVKKYLKNYMGIRRYKKPLIEALLKKREPQCLVVVVSYGRQIIIEVAKELEIPVVELQHGVINKYHKGYSYPGDREKEAFPDYLLTFGEYWNNIEYPIPDEKVIVTGYPYFDMMKKKFEDVEEKNQILFISQGTIGEKLSQFAVELSKQIEDYEIVYKLHPGEFSNWQERYPWLEESEIEVLTNEKQLYQLFAESKIQVGVYSTAIYEGLGFNLKTFLVDLPGIETMERLLDKKCCRKMNSAEELMENMEDEGDPEVDIEEFFKPNAKENIIEQLNRSKANQ
jgi:ribosomal protein S2